MLGMSGITKSNTSVNFHLCGICFPVKITASYTDFWMPLNFSCVRQAQSLHIVMQRNPSQVGILLMAALLDQSVKKLSLVHREMPPDKIKPFFFFYLSSLQADSSSGQSEAFFSQCHVNIQTEAENGRWAGS